MRYLGAAATCGIKRHQQNAMEGRQGCVDELCNLRLTEHLRQMEKLLRIRCLSYTPAPLQHLDVKETQSRNTLRDCVRCQLPLGKHQRLISADVLRTQAIGGSMEMLGVVFDGADIAANGSWSVVTTFQFFKHDLA